MGMPPDHEVVAAWQRAGFDVGYKAAQGMPRSSYLVNPLETLYTPTTSVTL